MIVELIPKKVEKPVFGQMFFLIVSFAVLAGVGIAFFILQQFIDTTRSNLETVEKQLTQDTKPQEQELAAKLNGHKQKVEDFKVIASKRQDLLPFFELLEGTTHPDIFFIDFAWGGDKNILVLGGQTKDFFALEQQRLVWKKEKDFQNVQLENMVLTDNGNGIFQVEFTLTPDFLIP